MDIELGSLEHAHIISKTGNFGQGHAELYKDGKRRNL